MKESGRDVVRMHPYAHGGRLELYWVYFCKFSSYFRKNWSVGNSLMARDHLVLSVDCRGTVIVTEMAMCDQGEFWVVWGRVCV